MSELLRGDEVFISTLARFIKFTNDTVPVDVQNKLFTKISQTPLYGLFGSPKRISDITVDVVITMFGTIAAYFRENAINRLTDKEQEMFRGFAVFPTDEGCDRLHAAVTPLLVSPELKDVYASFSTRTLRTRLFRFLSFFVAVLES